MKSIGANAFKECAMLETAIFCNNSSLEKIDSEAFMDSGIKKFKAPESLI